MFFQRVQVIFNRVVDAEVNHIKTGTFKHHRYKILANVMDIALDRANDHGANTRRPGFRQQRPQNHHAGFHRIGRHQNFRHKQDAITKINANDGHAFDQRLCQNIIGRPFARKKNLHAFHNFILHSVIKIVMHLLDKFVIIQIGKNNFFFISHGIIPRLALYRQLALFQ